MVLSNHLILWWLAATWMSVIDGLPRGQIANRFALDGFLCDESARMRELVSAAAANERHSEQQMPAWNPRFYHLAVGQRKATRAAETPVS